MIDDTIGKILGMAMAYGVSALGLFLAYVNYRKRTIGAEKVMTGTAWAVVAVVLLAIAGGVFVVSQLARPVAEAPAEAVEVVEAAPPPAAEASAEEGERERWPVFGLVFPAGIFLFATWITGALYRHFATHGHGGPDAEGGSS